VSLSAHWNDCTPSRLSRWAERSAAQIRARTD
jgi:hypothetical protein